MNLHPARTMPFSELYDGLQQAIARKLVNEQRGDNGLRSYCYSRECTYERQWDDITVLARGLILDVTNGRVIATPFPKFFNVGERDQTVPALQFETFEKLDGSLIIIFFHAGEWRCATKGSFRSEQAAWARDWIARHDLSHLDKSATYLAEAIYPENRIVIHYDHEGLFLLAAYDGAGIELSYDALTGVAERLGWPLARRHHFESVADLIAHTGALPATEEGYVLRFENGLRLKVKGEEYRRIHALISRCTPLAMWEAMQAGDNLVAIRRDLPEEFWPDFDQIITALGDRIERILRRVEEEATKVASWSDKELGLKLSTYPDDVRPFLFPYRKNDGDLMRGRAKLALFRHVRPTANRLPGYTPSYAMNRVSAELDP
jgi:RNA ligase